MIAKKVPKPVDTYVGSRIRMRRMMIGMSQEKLGDAIGLTFQQVQKYEKGTNRVGASRLQQIASVLQVAPAFFFEGAPIAPGEKRVSSVAPVPNYVSEFLASVDGLALVKAFHRITRPRLRRSIVAFVEQIKPDTD
jgi:transcriptional regulator with XRE-family HTH domain